MRAPPPHFCFCRNHGVISSWKDINGEVSGVVTTILSFGSLFDANQEPAFAQLALAAPAHSSWKLTRVYKTAVSNAFTVEQDQDWKAGAALDDKCPTTESIWNIVQSGTRLPSMPGTQPSLNNVLAVAVGKKSYHERTVLTCALLCYGRLRPCPSLLATRPVITAPFVAISCVLNR